MAIIQTKHIDNTRMNMSSARFYMAPDPLDSQAPWIPMVHVIFVVAIQEGGVDKGEITYDRVMSLPEVVAATWWTNTQKNAVLTALQALRNGMRTAAGLDP